MIKLKNKVATSIRQEGDDTVIRYHDTDIVRFNNDEIVLKTSGWYTVTTKRRMNQASKEFGLGFTVYQSDGEWFIEQKGNTRNFIDGEIFKRRVI